MTDPACLPFVEDVAWLHVDEAVAVGQCRRVATSLADRLGFNATRAAEVGLAVTEIGTNLYRHAQQGTMLVRSVRGSTQTAVEVVAVDSGPGIVDLDLAWRDGESTAGTLGVGLGAVARLSDSSAISSRPGRGTVLVARFHPRRSPMAELPVEATAGLTRAIGGEDVCGDAYAIRRDTDRLTLMLCDGSGHGPLAASAARAAVRVFCEQSAARPEDMVERIHKALHGTRGGALAVADIDLAGRSVRFAGLGNIAAAVVVDGQKKGMISVPGVAGYQARTIRAYDYPLPANAAVVMHSDGLTERWTPDVVDGMLLGNPLLVAATLLRDAGVRRDDASVLVASTP